MNEVKCECCFHHCLIKEGERGLCRVRKNEQGQNVDSNYGKVTSMALDPIEKKPLAMFYPGNRILSIGSFGCNYNCPFCQNYSISCTSEEDSDWQYFAPRELAEYAKSLTKQKNIGMAFTYNEPLVGWEFVRDTAIEIKNMDLKNVVVTNGSSSTAVLEEILPYIDAFNIDLKGFSESWYTKIGGNLKDVCDFIIRAASKAHVEITTLIVPGENDSIDEMSEISKWISSVDKRIPLHITRFFPCREMTDRDATDVSLMHRLLEEAEKHLENVFLGNV